MMLWLDPTYGVKRNGWGIDAEWDDIVLQRWSLTIISISGGVTAFNRRGGPPNMVRAIWGYKLLQCISRDGSTTALANPFSSKAHLKCQLLGLRIHFLVIQIISILQVPLTVPCCPAGRGMSLIAGCQVRPTAVSLCFKLRLIIIDFSFPVASCTQKIHLVSLVLWLFLPKPFKDLRHRYQGFRSYRDPPQFVTGESLTAVVCDGWFPKMIPILQHVSVVELIFFPLDLARAVISLINKIGYVLYSLTRF